MPVSDWPYICAALGFYYNRALMAVEINGPGLVVNETLVQLCCGGCAEKAQKYADDIILKVMAAARQSQVASYPLTTCPVSGDEIDLERAEAARARAEERLRGEATQDRARAEASLRRSLMRLRVVERRRRRGRADLSSGAGGAE